MYSAKTEVEDEISYIALFYLDFKMSPVILAVAGLSINVSG